ncbi:MAG TPA: dolichyl-phosphate beta-D-mannosyltransferase, partial [Nitrosomonas sp.]|nr:dolichyl-phosphate beta-D-mannosyltransferase [Nitrosomonas sp.]
THNDAKLEVRSRNMFGESGAMYEFWFPSEPPTQRPIIQVGMKRRHLEQTPSGVDVKTMLDHPGNIEYRVIERYGTPVRRVYYRVSEGFKGVGAPGT